MNIPNWVSDAIFYQIFPDRFAKSDRVSKQGLNLEPWDAPPTIYGFKGGDLRGVTEHLDYIETWERTPFISRRSLPRHPITAITHMIITAWIRCSAAMMRFANYSIKRIKKNIRVVLDGVFNHASRGFWQFHQTLENGAASPYVDWFHFDPDRLQGKKHWGAYPSPQEQEAIQREGSYKAIGYQGWWNLPALPKFNTQTPAVREFIFNVAEHWIKFGIDGWRLDVPGEIDDDLFWQEFRRRVKSINPEAYIVGEIWNDARRWLQGDQFDASMNYLVTAACLSFFTGKHLDLNETLKSGGYQGHVGHIDANEFANRIDSILGMYHPDVTRVQLNLLDSHDTPRFLTCAGRDLNSLKLALMFIFTYPGAPCIFYGDEIGLYGRHDPECRQPFPWDEFKMESRLARFYKGADRITQSASCFARRWKFQEALCCRWYLCFPTEARKAKHCLLR